MRGCLRTLIVLGVSLGSAFALGHSKQIAAINAYCQELQGASASQNPFVFSGPDPWTEVDEVPASMPDQAVSYVYTAGDKIRWVFMRIVDDEHGWSEDISYFFGSNGNLMKRDRVVQSTPANMTMEVISYYDGGHVLKESAHIRKLARGRRDTSQFNDPDAPVFWTTDDLPFPDILDLWRGLA